MPVIKDRSLRNSLEASKSFSSAIGPAYFESPYLDLLAFVNSRKSFALFQSHIKRRVSCCNRLGLFGAKKVVYLD